MTSKDLGLVTAYAYAVSQGYTGTEEEFAELMASYATVAEEAAESAAEAAASATAAGASETNAASSAASAGQSATSAGNSATSASGSAVQAQSSATAAGQSATQAAGSATAAGNSATAAAGSASQAAASETAAGASATAAAGSATSASGSATAAAGSATEADASADRAQEILDSIPEDYSELSEDVSDLKSATDELEQRVTALDGGDVDLSYDIVENSYVASTNGTIYNYNGWNRTSYISLKDVSKLKINIPQSTVYNYYYKEDQSSLENGNLRLVAGPNEVTIPDGAEYLICSGVAASINAMTVENGTEIAEDTNAKIELYKRGNLIDYDNVAVGYIDSTGTPYQSNNIWCTDFCELNGDKVFSYHLIVTQYFAFYDENKSKIATWEDTGAMKRYTSAGEVWYLDVPAGAKYFRGTTTYNPATYTTTWVSNDPETPNNYAENNVSNAFPYTVNPENPCDYSELTVRAFSKVVCIGDSLTYGGFNLSDSGTPTGETQSSEELSQRYSYPSNFERITGIETVNAGDSGETSVSWYAAHQNDDFSGYDLAIIFLGVNDSAFSVSDADTLTAMQNIVTMLNNARSDMRIAICSRIPAYEGAGYQVKGQLILNWAKSLNDPNIIPLDLAQYSHVKPRTSYVAGHCSALGYYMMALDIARYISWYMDQHKRDFRFIQFIGSPDAEWSGD